MTTTTIRVPDKIWREVKVLAVSAGIGVNELVGRILREYVERSKREAGGAEPKQAEAGQVPAAPAEGEPAEKAKPCQSA